ncbi:MAG TPA: protein-L-isoaspartate(D-aspartate) O-methyltransferase [Geminicoccaceae bacterium]
MRNGSLSALPLAAALIAAGAPEIVAADRQEERDRMVEVVEQQAQGVSGLDDGLDPAVADAMRSVPRHAFVPEEERDAAYENRPLPIGYGQTISQPFIVGLMSDLLDVGPGDTVLEVGTGSGYQAAVLAPLVERVYSIEIVPELGEGAEERLAALGYTNVETRVGDGYYGWPEAAPFDGIIVTAAASHVPPPLVEQLEPGGRMVIPVGSAFFNQQLMLVEKTPDGRITTRQLLPVRFVPFTGEHG